MRLFSLQTLCLRLFRRQDRRSLRRGKSASGLSAMVVETLGERILLTANVGIDVQDNAVPGEIVAVQVSYSGDNGRGQNGVAFVDSFGDTLLARTATDVESPSDGLFVGAGFEIVGGDNDRAARQFFQFTGDRNGVDYFDSLLSSGGGTGDRRGFIAEATPFGDWALYVGNSAGGVDSSQPTHWTSPQNAGGGIGASGQQDGGAFLAVSPSGLFVGTDQTAIYSQLGQLPKSLPGFSVGLAVDISSDAETIIGDLIRTTNTLGGYEVVVLNGSFSAVVNLGAGHDVLTSIGVDLDADLGIGNDVATSTGGHTVRLKGGNGNDVLQSVKHRFAFLDGGAGNDILTTNGFRSFVIGGAGSDRITALDRRSVVVSDIVQTTSAEQRRTLVDAVFAELGKSSPANRPRPVAHSSTACVM